MAKIGTRMVLVAVGAAAAAVMAASTATAATMVIGSVNLPSGGATIGTGSGSTLMQGQISPISPQPFVLRSPVNGTITSWSYRAVGTQAGDHFALRILRPANSSETTFTGAGTSPADTVPSPAPGDVIRGGFPVNLSIHAGDRIGLMLVSGSGTGIPVATTGANNPSTGDGVRYFAPGFPDFGFDATPANPGNNGQQVLVRATITFTPPTTCPPTCAPPPPQPKPSLTSFVLSPTTFRAASSGPSTRSAARRRKPPIGTKVSYRLSQAATTTFTVQRKATGRRVNHRCVAPKRSNRTKPRCTRYLTLRGSFLRTGVVGLNKFKFTGRLRGHKLPPGSYRLVGVAKNGNGTSRTLTASFRIASP